MTLLAATDNAPTLTDTRRITEDDADYQRLHARYARRLRGSIATLVRGLRGGDQSAVTAFLHRHIDLMREAYVAAHEEGQRDYWHTVSLKKPPIAPPDPHLITQRLAWYALGSVLKMAREATAAAQQPKGAMQHSEGSNGATATTARSRGILLAGAGDDPLAQWQASTDNRADLQAAIGWSGIQDGYLAGGRNDGANPFALVWWILEPAAQHCHDCPVMAENSPYNAPGSGGNELDRTPGDGRTECGAGCKCSLAYQPAGALEQQASDAIWSKWFNPQNLQAFATASGIGADLGYGYDPALVREASATAAANPPQFSIAAPADDNLSHEQMAALDSYRAAVDKWDAVRGNDLPAAPAFYSERLGELVGDELPDIALMTPAQRIALFELWDALQQWDEANAPDIEQDINFDQSFAETDGRALLLTEALLGRTLTLAEWIALGGHPEGYEQARKANGQWDVTGNTGHASGGGAHGRGGAVHEALTHSRGASGGGGGGGSGGGVRVRVTYEADARERLAAKLGRTLSDEDLAGLAGARHGSGSGDESAHVTVDRHGMLTIEHADTKARMETYLLAPDGEHPVAYVQPWSHTSMETGKPIAPDVRSLREQVRTARALGVRGLRMKSQFGSRDFLDLPRVGYNARIDEFLLAETRSKTLPDALRGHRTLLDLLATPEGARWWVAEGRTPGLEFDARHGSQSVARLNAVLRRMHEPELDA